MKQKVLKKPTLVLTAGLPGVGKTTLALELGRRLGWVVLEKDMLKEPFLEDPLLKEKVDEYTAGWAAYAYSLNVTENILVNQQLSVILDTSLLYPFILERAEQLAARSGAQLKIILCEVDESTRQHRLRTRKARISQAKAHLVPKEAAKQFDQLDSSSYKKIGTKRPLKCCVEEAFTYVTAQEQVQESEVEGYQSVFHRFNNPGPLALFFWSWIQWFVSSHSHKLRALPHFIPAQ